MIKPQGFKPLRFGTSGLRDKVENMTDMECYINTKGFMSFLKERGEIDSAKSTIALAGDLRGSTPRIMASVAKAITDSGCKVASCGKVPTPTLTYFSIVKKMPGIMVTGSHIPDDRNGIKFTKKTGEILKSDEADILRNVASVRDEECARKEEDSLFDDKGMFKEKQPTPEAGFEKEAIDIFTKRYLDVFPKDAFGGKKIVLYQHSAVGRDLLKKIFEGLGGQIITVGRSDEFIPVDTEKVSTSTIDLLKQSAKEYAPFAVVSTDGDSDRPLLADEKGEFLAGDKLGALVSIFLKPDFAAIPISANDAVVDALSKKGIEVKQTKIGSPYVVAAMNEKLALDPNAKVVSWESNGGFLTGSDWDIGGKTLRALPTRDAVLPLIAALLLAEGEGKSVSELIATSLPPRYTHADVVDDKTPGCEKYTADMGKEIIKMFSPAENLEKVDFSEDTIKFNGQEATDELYDELSSIKGKLAKYFNQDKGFSAIASINFTDGIRISFSNRDVAHIRPSGNAPEFRMYATADTQARADQIVAKRKEIVPEIVKDMLTGNSPRSVGAQRAGESTSTGRIIEAVSEGSPVYLEPYKEPKVWGTGGIGEYWYGGEEGEKSSIAILGEDSAPMRDVLESIPREVLGAKAIKKFGKLFPLVKILTPKGRLSVQFHDAKNELWIVTSAKGEGRIIVGFSEDAVGEYGDKVTEKYKEALVSFGDKLNDLIDALLEAHKSELESEKDAIIAAEEVMGSDPAVASKLEELLDAKSIMDSFYNYMVVKPGDVIPVPAGTLHALGAGVEVVEPQIPGPTQSLEDGATYPVRYYFPGHERPGARKVLDIDRCLEMKPEVVKESLPKVIKEGEGYVVERLPGGFEDKGLEVDRIDMKEGSTIELREAGSLHNLVTVKGKATLSAGAKDYEIPKANAQGRMLIVPACAYSCRITASEPVQIIDTFIPV